MASSGHRTIAGRAREKDPRTTMGVFYAAKARSALQAQDIENTKKCLELMQTELGKVEKFLGH